MNQINKFNKFKNVFIGHLNLINECKYRFPSKINKKKNAISIISFILNKNIDKNKKKKFIKNYFKGKGNQKIVLNNFDILYNKLILENE